MKKRYRWWVIVLLGLMVVIVFLLGNSKTPRHGKYVMKLEDPHWSWVLLEEDNRFVVNRRGNLSYRPQGEYVVEGDQLTLYALGNEIYVFAIKKNALILKSASDATMVGGSVYTFVGNE